MGLKAYNENDIQNIANSIRNKGVSGNFTVAQMASNIDNITTGGSYGTLNVTTNGIYNNPSPYDAWDEVNVQVPGGDFSYNGILEDTLPNQNFYGNIQTAGGWRNGQDIIDIKGINSSLGLTLFNFSGNKSLFVGEGSPGSHLPPQNSENFLYQLLPNSLTQINFRRTDILRDIIAFKEPQASGVFYGACVHAWCGPNVTNMDNAYANCFVDTIVCGPNVKDFTNAYRGCNKINTEMTDTLCGTCGYDSFYNVPAWIVNIPYIEIKFENDRTSYGSYQLYLSPINTGGGVFISNFQGYAPGGTSSFFLDSNIFGNVWFNNFVMYNRYSLINKFYSDYVIVDTCLKNAYSGSQDVVFSSYGTRTKLTNILFTPNGWDGDTPLIGYRDLNWLCNNTRNTVVWESGTYNFTVNINKHYRNNNQDELKHQCNFSANLKANIAAYNLDVYFGVVVSGG